MPTRGGHQRVPAELSIQMGVNVHKPRGDDLALCVDHPGVGGRVDLADLDDTVAADPHVRRHARCAGAIYNLATANNQIEAHTIPLLSGCSAVTHAPDRLAGATNDWPRSSRSALSRRGRLGFDTTVRVSALTVGRGN